MFIVYLFLTYSLNGKLGGIVSLEKRWTFPHIFVMLQGILTV